MTRSSLIADAVTIELPSYARDDGVIVVAQASEHVPFAVARMFTVEGTPGAVRGQHAHKRCSQFMLCVSGVVEFLLDDGGARKFVTFDRGDKALLVPPMLWQSVTFRAPQSILVVLCDRPYEEDDYIRDYEAFLDARR